MTHQSYLAAQNRQHLNEAPELRDIVMGLHWDPPENAASRSEDLDAICVLLDSNYRALDIIHPDHPRNADGSVVHTGDSRTGASTWDDERIFVFLPALPKTVAAVAFIALSAGGRPFGDIRGASCHISDQATEYKWLELQLTELHDQTSRLIGVVTRHASGWTISADQQTIPDHQRAELIALAGAAKGRQS